MKKLVTMVIAVVSLTSLIRCSTNDQTMNSNDVVGNWIVHQFMDDGQNKTSNYSGYVFAFSNGGALSATKSGNATAGTWSKFTDSGREKLTLSWNGGGIPVELLEIEEDWIIKSNSNGLMVLADTSGSTGKVKELHFQKQY